MNKIALLALAFLGCAISPASRVPVSLRPDTRQLYIVQLDSSKMNEMLRIFIAREPNEALICVDGRLNDDSIIVTNVYEAQIDSATPSSAWPTHLNVCPKAAGYAHDHLRNLGYPCNHSNPDAILLASDRYALFSFVFCDSGEGQLLWQDGRRFDFTWGELRP